MGADDVSDQIELVKVGTVWRYRDENREKEAFLMAASERLEIGHIAATMGIEPIEVCYLIEAHKSSKRIVVSPEAAKLIMEWP